MSSTTRFTDAVSMLARSVEHFGSRPLFGEKLGGAYRWLRYAEFATLVDQARSGLAALGVGRGDRVAVISNNRFEWAVGCYAAFGLGAAYVPMYEAQPVRDWRYILGDSGARVCLVASDAIRDLVAELKPDLPSLTHVISFEGSGEGSHAALLTAGAARPAPAAALDPTDIASVIYTSGTTGEPKGVRLSHKNLSVQISALYSSLGLDETMELRTLSILPWAHVAGGVCELHGTMSLGGALGICEGPDKLLANLAEVRPTVLCAVPRVWNRIYDGVRKQIAARPRFIRALFERALGAAAKRRGGARLTLLDRVCLAFSERVLFRRVRDGLGGQLKYVTSGAAALSADVVAFIDDLGIALFESYGMTEMCGIATANTPAARRIGSVGRPLPGFSIRIDKEAGERGDNDDNDDNDENGEIILFSGSVMEGYHGLPEENLKVMTADGGLRSGDLGHVDADGFLFITGRVKDIYKLSNGKYVSPAPLEEKLTQSPFILQAMVHGAGRPHNIALIVPDLPALLVWAAESGADASSTERLLADPRTRRLFAAEIAARSDDCKRYEKIQGFALIPEELSVQNGLLTPTLKVKRRKVVERYRAEIDARYR